MSCEDCDKAQESKEHEYYFRIGTANVLCYGCKKHITELQTIIRKDNIVKDIKSDVIIKQDGEEYTLHSPNREHYSE